MASISKYCCEDEVGIRNHLEIFLRLILDSVLRECLQDTFGAGVQTWIGCLQGNCLSHYIISLTFLYSVGD